MKDKKGAFARISGRVRLENKIFVDLGLDISKEIKLILSTHPTIKTQKALAEKMGKEESEISRMLSGLHNITLESISKVSAVLGREIITTASKAKDKYSSNIVVASPSVFWNPSVGHDKHNNNNNNNNSMFQGLIFKDKLNYTTHAYVK